METPSASSGELNIETVSGELNIETVEPPSASGESNIETSPQCSTECMIMVVGTHLLGPRVTQYIPVLGLPWANFYES